MIFLSEAPLCSEDHHCSFSLLSQTQIELVEALLEVFCFDVIKKKKNRKKPLLHLKVTPQVDAGHSPRVIGVVK